MTHMSESVTSRLSDDLEDVQNHSDERQIPIDQVGVSGLRYPIFVLDRAHQRQETVATVSMSVGLPHHFKGTHMSRFVEVLNEHRGEVTMRTLPAVLHDLCKRLDAESARVELAFPYFIERAAPISGAAALMDYDCTFIAETKDGMDDFVLRVGVPVTTVCPCSKTISDRGAHNQRGVVSVEVRGATHSGASEFIWIEELIELAEQSASAPVYSLLKRPDERHLTMHAYDHPVFVEDVVRNVAHHLQADERVAWFRVACVNQESIHNHNAFAKIEWSREPGFREKLRSAGA